MFEAYTGIIQGLAAGNTLLLLFCFKYYSSILGNKLEQLYIHIPGVIEFIKHVTEDIHRGQRINIFLFIFKSHINKR